MSSSPGGALRSNSNMLSDTGVHTLHQTRPAIANSFAADLREETGAIERALQRSVLAKLPHELIDRVMAGALRVNFPAGSIVYREGDTPRCGLMVSGLARVFLLGPDGRQVT